MCCRREPGERSLSPGRHPAPPRRARARSNAKRQLKAALADRDAQAQRVNELSQQLQDKKRQLFSAIQEREGLRQQHRALEAKCRDFQEALQCKLCRAVRTQAVAGLSCCSTCCLTLGCGLAPPCLPACCQPACTPFEQATSPLPCPPPTPRALQVQRNCVVLPCLHFLYCDACVKQHCSANPQCPACSRPATGFQTLLMHR